MQKINFCHVARINIKCPCLIMLAASMQSPWSLSRGCSKWANLVSDIGFGFTLPFQATFAIKIAKAIKKVNNKIKFINACYPDEVNPLLRAMNLPITIGVGNIAILASYLSSSLKIKNESLKMIGHHFHVEPSEKFDSEEYSKPKVWINDAPFEYSNLLLLNNIRNVVTSSESNQITGMSAAEVIVSLMSESKKLIHAPGPNGLPGGYPVLVGNGEVEIALPKDVMLEDAIKFNINCSKLDGVWINSENNSAEFGINILNQLESWTGL